MLTNHGYWLWQMAKSQTRRVFQKDDIAALDSRRMCCDGDGGRRRTSEESEGPRESKPLGERGRRAISTGPSTAQRRTATEQADSAQRPERGEGAPSGESAA
jgi:hypothetical protein